jgi:hypothetical protein
MKYIYDFHTTEWIWTFVIGFPLFATIARLRWQRARNSFLWRWILCVILACIVSPFIYFDTEGVPVIVDVIPAGMMLIYLPVGLFSAAFSGQLDDCLASLKQFWTCIPAILVVSMVLMAIWSAIAFAIRKELTNK